MVIPSRQGKSWNLFLLIILGTCLLVDQISGANLYLPKRNKRSDSEDEYDRKDSEEYGFDSSSSEDTEPVTQGPDNTGNHGHQHHFHHIHHDHNQHPPIGDNDQDSHEDSEDDSIHGHPIDPPGSPNLKVASNESAGEETEASEESVEGHGSHETGSKGHSHGADDGHHGQSSHVHQPPVSKSLPNGGAVGEGSSLTKVAETSSEEVNNDTHFHAWVGACLVVLLVAIAIGVMIILNNVRKRKYGSVSTA